MASEKPLPSIYSFILSMAVTAIFFPLILFPSAGTWRWVEGWVFCIWMIIMVISNATYQYIKDPDLLAERSKLTGGGNQKKWDRFFLPFAYIMFMVWFVFIPFDAVRYGWSPVFPLWLKFIGGLLLLPSLYFIYFATAQNTFLSTRVRIQSERKQRVISTGVYGFVRHPLYLGGVLMLIGAPLLTGSLVGSAISLIALISLVIRIIGEEKMLFEELDGYHEYAAKVHYRLFPFIW
jgi:protein-S-isoprenylcysteine O-methyltransferase Ste14